MKLFVYLLCTTLLATTAFANTKSEETAKKNKENNKAVADKSSDSKPKRDASHLVSSYHGPSYKYLPPTSGSSYFDSYAGNNAPTISLKPGAGYNGGLGIGYKTHGHFGGFAHAPYYGGSAHHGYHSGGGGIHGVDYIAGNANGHGIGSFGHKHYANDHVDAYALGHGYSSSGNGYKYTPHALSGGHKIRPVVAAGGNHYANGPGSSGHTFSSSPGLGLSEVHHHSDHVHNGGQEHIYIASSGSSNFRNGHHGVNELPVNSYIPVVQQHAIPTSSYGDTYNNQYHQFSSQAVEKGPGYAAGHKGLRHFGYTANKPQALHTKITGASLDQPSFSKAPFKPSTFLGVKYEGNSNENYPYEQYSPALSTVNSPTGYNYLVPDNNGAAIYQPENYQPSGEQESVSNFEPDSTYLPPHSNERLINEYSSSNGNYLATTS